MNRLRPRLIIVNSEQFGYHTDTYYYCKYLQDRFDITYIGWDHGLERIELSGVEIVYVDRSGGPFRVIRLLSQILARSVAPDTLLFCEYFNGMSLFIKIARFRNPIVLDIRTCSVEPGRLTRVYQDSILTIVSKLFSHITVISSGLASRLGLDQERAVILPLGAEVISSTQKEFHCLKLLYVGTLWNRDIDKVVEAFSRFVRNDPGPIPPTLTIIGEGLENEKELLEQFVQKNGLGKNISILGAIPHDALQDYFDSHNVGLTYVPMTDYYDVQPATKTYEYLLSGLGVIATATTENKRVVNDSNGVLTGDTIDAFYNGLVSLSSKMNTFDSREIRNSAQQYNWKNITDNLADYLDTLSQKSHSQH